MISFHGPRDVNTKGQLILNVTNSTTGGQRSLNIVDYTFDGPTDKHLQSWTVIPKHNALLRIYYLVADSIIKSVKFTK